MPENETEATETESQNESTESTADATAEAEKWKALARKHEQRAKENADKAKRLDELEESSKSDLEKATARAEAAEKALAGATLERDRMSVVLAKGLDPELAPLLSGETKEDIEKQAELLASRLSTTTATKPAARTLKSGASGKDDAGLSGKERAAAAVRQLRGAQ